MNGLPSASTRLPPKTSVRPGWPSLKMTTPDAPAAWALRTFTPKLHVPRWISAILPAHEAGEVGRGAAARRARASASAG